MNDYFVHLVTLHASGWGWNIISFISLSFAFLFSAIDHLFYTIIFVAMFIVAQVIATMRKREIYKNAFK